MTRQAVPACHRRAGRPPWSAAVASRVHTPPHADAALADLTSA